MAQGQKPTHAILLVKDDPKNPKYARWQHLGKLWPTQDGDGFSGPVELCAPLLLASSGLRLVIVPIDTDTGNTGFDPAKLEGEIPE